MLTGMGCTLTALTGAFVLLVMKVVWLLRRYWVWLVKLRAENSRGPGSLQMNLLDGELYPAGRRDSGSTFEFSRFNLDLYSSLLKSLQHICVEAFLLIMAKPY
ncbi:hypothetical protein O9992_30925 [Vibrio lentus]|nr:hypothetical protein [Vibrio lentus]